MHGKGEGGGRREWNEVGHVVAIKFRPHLGCGKGAMGQGGSKRGEEWCGEREEGDREDKA